MAAREEQETIISMGRVSDYMSIWTNNIVHVRALEKESRAVRQPIQPYGNLITAQQLADHLDAGFGVEYHVAAKDSRILGVFARKTREMTAAEKAQVAERLAAGRKA